MSGDAVIETRDAYMHFPIQKGMFSPKKTLRAVNGISLAVERGETLAVVGESGCGKSTLAKMILGLLKPTGGEILFDGVDLQHADRIEIARRVQPIFQDPYSSLNPRKTLEEIISLPLIVHKIGTPEERRKQVEDLMQLVGLPKRMIHTYPSQLSGGQRQRVAIARALIMKPDVVVCDEPTSALDVSVQAQILNLLLDLKRELNLTYVFISHDLAVVEHIADRLAVMYLGRIVEMGDAGQMFDNPRHPYTKALLGSILTPDHRLSVPDYQMELGGFPDPMNPPSGCSFHPRCQQVFEPCAAKRPPTVHDEQGLVECYLYTEERV